MKITAEIILLIVVVLALGGEASSFTPPLNKQANKRRVATRSGTALAGWLDFKPIHGGGNDDKANDEMFEAQQEILRARRGNLDKEELKKKYAKRNADEFSKIKTLDQVDVTRKQDAAMYVDEEEETKFKFPWQK
jgi:hypothetical protein